MTGLPFGRGRKGGKPKRVRNHREKRMPELTIPAASGTANASSIQLPSCTKSVSGMPVATVPPVISCTPVTSFCQSIT